MMMVLAMVPTVALAADPWPAPVNGVITLEAGKTYGSITLTEGVTIEGNGATVGVISIKTDQPVTIKGVNFTNYVYLEQAVETGGRYQFKVTIEGCVFGTPGTSDYRRIYMPENNKPQDGYMVVKNCIFYEAKYCVNLLSVTKIHFEDNTFYSGPYCALQYTVTPENKDNINIINNIFNGTGEALKVTIADGSSDANASIGNVYNNTFNGTRMVVAVSDMDVQTLTVLRNNGLNASNIWFSSWSLNPRFKPAKTGPLSGDMLQNLIFANGTKVMASVDPTFTIVIPAAVNLGTLQKGVDVPPQTFEVEAKNVIIEEGKSIVVSVASDFTLSTSGGATLGYKLYNSTSEVGNNGTFATFTADRIESGSVRVPDTSGISVAGVYQDTMTFTISYQ